MTSTLPNGNGAGMASGQSCELKCDILENQMDTAVFM